VRVKVLETDEKGRVKLSMKALMERPEAPPAQDHGHGGDQDGHNHDHKDGDHSH
jgi:polyribonucleotide nucleotidyltransferase